MGKYDYVIALEREAFELSKQGNYRQAADIFSRIVTEAPFWEHGACFYNLAGCLEDLGEFESARTNYLKALEYQPDDPIRLGGYASFLYLRGEWRESFEIHLRLLRIERAWLEPSKEVEDAYREVSKNVEQILCTLRTLALNLRMSDSEFTQQTGVSLK